MFKKLWLSFIPTSENDYRPYFLRLWPVVVLFLVIVGLYGVASIAERSLTHKGGYLAAVVSAVLVDLTNFDRAAGGLGGLALNPVLQTAAEMKAADMAGKSYFAHTSPAGVTPWHWFKEAGYAFSYAGENLAVYFTDSADVERAWMNSPGHRANILSPHFTEIGIATAEGYYQGKPTTFVVQMFGTPVVKFKGLTTGQAPLATSSPPVATSTLALVKGEATSTPPEVLTVIHEDDEFIAVKDASAMAAPSAYAVEEQSTFWARVVTSPTTLLGYAYLALAALVFLALILMVILEIRIQRPRNAIFAVCLILLMALLLYFTDSRVFVDAMHL